MKEETKLKIKKTMTGRKVSAQALINMSLSQ